MQKLQLGNTEILHVRAGDFRLDGGAMFGVVPRALWSRVCPPDELNRIGLACNCIILRRPDALVLVETGCGDRFTEKERHIFAIGGSSLSSALHQLGLEPESITHVVLTHLHFDHAAGALEMKGEDLIPVCPNATHFVQRGEWDDALAGKSVMKSSYIVEDLEALSRSGRVEYLHGDADILPGLSVQVTGGHTPHHQAVVARDGGQTLVYAGDLIPTRAHLSPYWIMAYDMNPYETLLKKRELVERASSEGWIIAWDHDAEMAFSTLTREGDMIVAVAVNDGA